MTWRVVDANVLIYAHLASFPEHARTKQYLQTLLSDLESDFAVFDGLTVIDPISTS